MSLNHLIPHLDAEIDRLQRARDLLASVASHDLDESYGDLPAVRELSPAQPSPSVAAQPEPKPTPPPRVTASEPIVHIVRPRRAYTRHEPALRKKHSLVEDTALRGPVPAGPVVVSAEEVRKAQAFKTAQASRAAEAKRGGSDLASSLGWRRASGDGRNVDSLLQRLIHLGEENTKPDNLGGLSSLSRADAFEFSHHPLVSKLD